MAVDKETQELISEGSELRRLTTSPEWETAKKYLNEMFVQLDSWSSLPDGMTPAQKLQEMQNRQAAISLVQQWFSIVEGKANQSKATAKVFIDRKNVPQVYSYFEPAPEQTQPLNGL